jgi:ABC-type amino acid transport substrate-binding protein
LVALLCSSASASEPTLKVCLDPEPPPWSYWERDKGGHKTGKLAGFSLELLDLVMTRIGRRYQVVAEMPWLRCLRSVARGEVDMAIDAYYTPDRAQVLRFSKPYNTGTPQVWFLVGKPLRVRSRDDLKSARGCGLRLRSTDYPRYGLAPQEMQLVTDFETVVVKLKSCECDYFPEEFEVIEGYRHSGFAAFAGVQLASAAVPWVPEPRAHMVVGLGPAGEALIPKLDAEITAAIASGEAARLWAKYGPYLPYRP